MSTSIKIILVGIVLLTFVLRFYRLSEIPPSLTWDEVAWGYNAYSLGVDGRDEFGKFLPLTYLESFGDFKPPLYAYLSVVSVKLFGLTEFSTRFVSAFLGSATILLTFLLVLKIFSSRREYVLALIASFLLAISPWHIMLSRAAFEANVATFFIVVGVVLFLSSFGKKKWLLSLSILSFVLSMYTFNTARIVSPLLLFGLFLGHYKLLFSMKRQIVIAVLVNIILVVVLALFLRTPQASLRFKEVNIFSDIGVINRLNQHAENDNNAIWSRIIHNRRLAYGAEFVKHYFDNLTPQFLFIKGDGNPKFSIQDVGQLYIWEIPFFLYGIFLIFRKRDGKWWIIPYWLLIGIIPAATARETPHALRIEATLPTFQIISAYGVFNLIHRNTYKMFGRSFKKLFIVLLCLVVFLNFIYFLWNYFVHYPREYSGEWQYGYKESIQYAESVKDQYDYIVFTQDLGRPYAYVLFYGRYHPLGFRASAEIEREALGFVHVKSFGKYIFASEVGSERIDGKVLYIDTPGNVPNGAEIKKTFNLLNGRATLVAYEN